jgi:large subunit ribosomal protein L23
MHQYDVLRRPLITEKGTIIKEQSKYMFEVAIEANKKQIKKAVEEAFKVKVHSVNIMSVPGRRSRWGRFQLVGTPWKKAVVTLEPNYKIELFEGV